MASEKKRTRITEWLENVDGMLEVNTKILNGWDDDKFMADTGCSYEQTRGYRDRVALLVSNFTRYKEHCTVALNGTDHSNRRHCVSVRIPDWMPEVRQVVDDRLNGKITGQTIRDRLEWADSLFGDDIPDAPAMPEPKYGASAENLDHKYQYRLNGKAYRVTLMSSDLVWLDIWEDRIRQGGNRLGGRCLDELRLEKVSDLIVFLMFADVFFGVMSWDAVWDAYAARAELHRNDGNVRYREKLRSMFRYRFDFNPCEYTHDLDYLTRLADRPDVPTFILWLIRCDMAGEEVPYPVSKRSAERSRRKGPVMNCLLSLEPGEDGDVKEWLDSRGWLFVDPRRWGFRSDFMNRTGWKKGISVSAYVLDLIGDYYYSLDHGDNRTGDEAHSTES